MEWSQPQANWRKPSPSREKDPPYRFFTASWFTASWFTASWFTASWFTASWFTVSWLPCRGSLCRGSLCRGYPVVGVRPKPSSKRWRLVKYTAAIFFFLRWITQPSFFTEWTHDFKIPLRNHALPYPNSLW